MIITPISPSTILEAAHRLPSAPRVMARLYKLLLDMNSGLSAIAQLLKQDAALTARVIRIANSPAYGHGGMSSIEDALQRIGFSEVYRFVGVATTQSMAEEPLICYNISGHELRLHNLYVALACETLAKRTKQNVRTAYTMGLLRTIGLVLLDKIGRSETVSTIRYSSENQRLIQDWELNTFGVNHMDTAGVLLEDWGFPAEVVAAVKCTEDEVDPSQPMSCLIWLADYVVRAMGHGLAGELPKTGIPRHLLEALCLNQDEISVITEEVRGAFNGLNVD